jgi:hypothetical protein
MDDQSKKPDAPQPLVKSHFDRQHNIDRTKFPTGLTKSDADALARIERFILDPPENSRIFTITPTMAPYLLDKYNVTNRPKKRAKQVEFAADMSDDLWFLTGDTLKFSDKRIMRDGQNRLYACIRAGKSFRTHIVFGIPDEAFAFLDRGRPRTGSDALLIGDDVNKVKNAKTVELMVRWLELFRLGRVRDRLSFTPREIVTAFRIYEKPRIEEAIERATAVVHGCPKTPRHMSAALYYLFSLRDEALAADFFASWEAGGAGSRMKPLHRALAALSALQKASSGRVHYVVRMAIYVTAWNLVVKRQQGNAKSFEFDPKADPFPEIKG